MYFKVPRTGFFKEIGPHRDGDMIDLLGGEPQHWLGSIDVKGARLLSAKRAVALPFAGWRLRELDPWIWLEENTVIMGCETEDGVFAVLDHQKPIIRKAPSQEATVDRPSGEQ